MTSTPTPAAIWLRVSTDEQDAKNQLASIMRFCEAHNLVVVKRTRSANRPGTAARTVGSTSGS